MYVIVNTFTIYV